MGACVRALQPLSELCLSGRAAQQPLTDDHLAQPPDIAPFVPRGEEHLLVWIFGPHSTLERLRDACISTISFAKHTTSTDLDAPFRNEVSLAEHDYPLTDGPMAGPSYRLVCRCAGGHVAATLAAPFLQNTCGQTAVSDDL